ncbi:hypothetical protein NQ318_016881 [Aromia moschata]|uniref:Mos1 transposase HTH domain-containing protein n=1 Tax=Aromia moschata TaxID=1265417 RepID=A0AAV8X2X7_9CUCU|nr:hypothetical protein NQ318_016881 [Aromia moschata]
MTSEVAISCGVHPLAFAAASNCLRYMDHDDCPSYVGGLSILCTDLSVCIRLECCNGVAGEVEQSPESAIESSFDFFPILLKLLLNSIDFLAYLVNLLFHAINPPRKCIQPGVYYLLRLANFLMTPLRLVSVLLSSSFVLLSPPFVLLPSLFLAFLPPHGPPVAAVRPPVVAVRPPAVAFPLAFLPPHGPPVVVVLPPHGPPVVVVLPPHGPFVVVVRPPVVAFPLAFLPPHGPPAVVVHPPVVAFHPLAVAFLLLVAKILESHSHPSSSFPRLNRRKKCSELGKTFTEAYAMLKEVYGNECVSRTQVFEWFKLFKEGRETTDDIENIEQIAFLDMLGEKCCYPNWHPRRIRVALSAHSNVNPVRRTRAPSLSIPDQTTCFRIPLTNIRGVSQKYPTYVHNSVLALFFVIRLKASFRLSNEV